MVQIKMTYSIKSTKNKVISRRATELHLNFLELDNKAEEIYGSNFKDLSWKEQRQISKKVAKGFHFKVH
jgi:hypothetical protein